MRVFTILGLMGSFVMASCGTPNAQSRQKVIVGDNDLEEVSDDHLLIAIGKVGADCTGFHVGGGFVLTASHCLSEKGRGQQLLYSWLDRSTFQGAASDSPLELVQSPVEEILAQEESAEQDYALLRISGVPSEALRVNFELTSEIPFPVTLVSYPKGRPLSTSGLCTIAGVDYGSRYFHDCDSTGGSSGGPLLDPSGRAIAIHNRGSAYFKRNSATLLRENAGLREILESKIPRALSAGVSIEQDNF